MDHGVCDANANMMHIKGKGATIPQIILEEGNRVTPNDHGSRSVKKHTFWESTATTMQGNPMVDPFLQLYSFLGTCICCRNFKGAAMNKPCAY